jgi:hypothetical protein
MGDPRNVAHNKKVTQEKHHHKEAAPAKKAERVTSPGKKQPAPAESGATAQPSKQDHKPDPTVHEKSVAILSKIKEMEFHSRANIEKLAELSLAIEDELKQKAFVESIGALYSAQDAFHSKVTAFITAYEAECERSKPTE